MKWWLVLGLSVVLIAGSSVTQVVTEHTPKQRLLKPMLTHTDPIFQENMAKILTAELALQRNQPELAEQLYKELSERTRDPRIAKRATAMAIEFGKYDDARHTVQIWAEDKTDLEAQLSAATILLQSDEIAATIPYLLNVHELDPKNATEHYLSLFQQLPEAHTREAYWDLLESLSQETPMAAYAPVMQATLGEVELMVNNPKAALARSVQILAIHPDSADALILEARVLVFQDEKSSALKLLDSVLPKFKDNLDLHLLYWDLKLQSGQKAQIFASVKSWVNKTEDPTEQLQLARLCMQGEWFALAKSFLEKAEQDEEHRDPAQYFLGRLAELEQDMPTAITEYQAVESGPFHIAAHLRAAQLYGTKNKYEDALEVLSNANPHDPAELREVVLLKADLLEKNQNPQLALEALNKGLLFLPQDPTLLTSSAKLARQLQDWEVLRSNLTQILTLEGKHLAELQELIGLLMLQFKDFTGASQWLQSGFHNYAEDPKLLELQGDWYYLQSDFKQARTWYEKAWTHAPNPMLAARLGEVMWKLGQNQAAEKIWQLGLQSAPKHQVLLDTMEKFRPQAP